MIDAHCHLYSDKFEHDLDVVIRRAQKYLSGIVISAVDLHSLEKSLDIRRRYPDFIHVTAGIHPRNTAELDDDERRQLWRAIGCVRAKIIAVGEVGPDFYHVQDPKERRKQLQVLEEALSHAEKWELPLVIHARNAEAAALEIVSHSRIPVMFHCFTGSMQDARKIVEYGYYLSFSTLLFTHPELQKVVKKIPADLILTETDSPALSPHMDQARNEPAFMEKVVLLLSKLLEKTFDHTAEMTAENARRFYKIKMPIS